VARGNMPTLQKGLRKTARNLSEGSESPGGDFNPAPPKREAGPRHLITTDLSDKSTISQVSLHVQLATSTEQLLL